MISRFFSFKGRLGRWQYFKNCMLLWVISLIFQLVVWGITGFSLSKGEMPFLLKLVSYPFQLAVWVASITLMTRRLHDLNKSGWWQLIFQVPVVLGIAGFVMLIFTVNGNFGALGWTGVGLILLAFAISIGASLWILFVKGTVGTNDYGPDPLAEQPVELDM